jgi:hypothetical protein
MTLNLENYLSSTRNFGEFSGIYSSTDSIYCIDDNLGIINFLEDFNKSIIKISLNSTNYNWKQINFNQPNKLKEFVYSFNFNENIKILLNIMKKDTILQKDSELINYLNYYFIRLLEENKVIGLTNNFNHDNDCISLNSFDINKLYIIIFNTGLITPNNHYIYSININIKNNITNSIISPPGFQENYLKEWTCINFIDELELDQYIILLSKKNNIIPEILKIKKYITIADFLFSSSILLKQSEIIFNPYIQITKSKKILSEMCTKFKQYYFNKKQKNIPSNIIKLDENELVNIIFTALDISIKKFSRNTHMIVHQYYFDSFISKGSVQLLIPLCLDNNNKNWTPHCVIGLQYVNGSYEISTLLCLKFARLNARLVSEYNNGLWNVHYKNLDEKNSDYSINSNDTVEEINDGLLTNKINCKCLRPCKHHFGLSGCKINSCKNSDNCHFSHDINKVKVCKMWESSFCKNGDKCDFLHGKISNGKIKY